MSKIYKTAIGKVSYPKTLFNPKRNEYSGKEEYSVDLIFPKSKDPAKDPLNVVRNAIEEAIKAQWPTKRPPMLHIPIKDGDGLKPKAGTPYDEVYHGSYFITLKNTRRPQLVDAKLQRIEDEADIYGGCYGRASFTVYTYEKKGNKGVSLSLVNFQKTSDGEAISGTRSFAEDDFEVLSDESDNPANYNSMLS